MKAKYIHPFTDFGFKKIFGEEASKPILIDFLNALLPQHDKIKTLSFESSEQLGKTAIERKAVFDIYCENERGEKFIVELQKAKQNYFIERTIYYATFPIREQAEKGNWNFNINAVYCIGILDFTFDDYETEPEKSEVVHTVKLKNQNGKVFYDKLTFIYLEIPNFTKTEFQLVSRLDKWLYFIKHLEDFENIPKIFADEVFTKAFEKAEIAKFGPNEMDSYEYSLKIFRDNINTYEYAKETAYKEGNKKGLEEGIEQGIEKGIEKGIQKGIEKGIEKGKQEGIKIGILEGEYIGKLKTAKSLKIKGIPIDIIKDATGLSEDEIENC